MNRIELDNGRVGYTVNDFSIVLSGDSIDNIDVIKKKYNIDETYSLQTLNDLQSHVNSRLSDNPSSGNLEVSKPELHQLNGYLKLVKDELNSNETKNDVKSNESSSDDVKPIQSHYYPHHVIVSDDNQTSLLPYFILMILLAIMIIGLLCIVIKINSTVDGEFKLPLVTSEHMLLDNDKLF